MKENKGIQTVNISTNKHSERIKAEYIPCKFLKTGFKYS